MKRCRTLAQPNIALIKYWGKRPQSPNIPAVGSISVTLDSLVTETTVEVKEDGEDEFQLLGTHDTGEAKRVLAHVTEMRRALGFAENLKITSRNSFPTGAGLASSASGFAALVVAVDSVLGLGLTKRELSIWARRGSGSAARSIFGGYVEMLCGEAADGHDSYAEPLADEKFWPLEVCVVVVDRNKKSHGSTDAMELSRKTSPYYQPWLAGQPEDLRQMRRAIKSRDFLRVAQLSESSCLKMHSLAHTSSPSVFYWHPTTVALMHWVWDARKNGRGVFFTIDAGPQVKIFCEPGAAKRTQEDVSKISGVVDVLFSKIGSAARIVPL